MPRTRIARLAEVPVKGPWQGPGVLRPERFRTNEERQLGRAVGVDQFGANLLTLGPGGYSSLRHWHEGEDEFVHVLSGEVVLIDDNGEHPLGPGDSAGFKAGVANAHHLANRTAAPATLLVVGARKRGEERIHYPDDPERGVGVVVRGEDGERL
jgi:uncharacterized cupin superfamily protein